MKKQLLNLSLIAGAIMLFATTSFGQYVEPLRTAEVPAITEIPVMDGLATEAFWSADQDVSHFSEKAGDWDGPADFTNTFKFAWSYSAFYMFVDITDDVDHSWVGGNAWEFDNMEFFFQLDTSTVPTAYSDVTVQLRFNRGDSGWNSSPGRAAVADYDWYWENTASGWVLEAAIPWTAVLADGALPEDIMDHLSLIGFDYSGADSDGTDPQVGARATGTQAAWDGDGDAADLADGTEDNAWNNTSIFGNVTLAGTPITATSATAADDAISVYPNPALNTITFTGVESGIVSIYSIAGSLVMEADVSSSVDISSLTSGVYVARIENTAVRFVVQ